ncbi:ribosome recycling factor [Terrimicrobium sacchariphilum]|uniref:Ribosome-recycling factor n=1 Tax=Terrimicrobium sacchariphilum TaxID=690879 RepID=A0A146G8U1_TERSA|nr:ribosome recycling factor [Terrimicrobium sacchariphilum]GAT33891.1 ribosome recycling factor [Terrimicrobium sacchariphilum]
MSLEEAIFESEAGMDKAVEFMLHEFAAIRTGKASPALVENLDVDAYGSLMKLKQLALISAPEPRLLVIQPFDASTVRDIERAINESKIGITPAVDGKLIRIPIPELSEERRRDLAKTVKSLAEDARVRVRACRREAMEAAKKLQKDGKLTEDDLRVAETDIQKMTDKYVASVDKHVETKEAELMKI